MTVVEKTIREEADRLREKLARIVAESNVDSILFSGGLDTAVLASLVPGPAGDIVAVTVTLDGNGEDLYYAKVTARALGLDHRHLPVTTEEAISALPEVIRATGSFDPALPNDLAVYFGMKYLAEQGCKVVLTGDGTDEMFAGYQFMQEMIPADAAKFMGRIAPRMAFSSNILARLFNLDIVQPFTDPDIIDFALSTPMDFKIREESGTVCGKWLVRKAFEGLLPREVVWQGKRPLEYGSGMTRLRETVAAMVPDGEYLGRTLPVAFMSKEHYYYYKVYREAVGEIPGPGPGEEPCPSCGAGMAAHGFHCRTCGYVADWRKI